MLTVLIVLPVTTVAASEPAAPTLAERLSQIKAADLERHCRFLASDALEGRGAGSRGGQAAAAYLVSELKQLQLSPPPGQKEFRQPFGNQWANVVAAIPGRHPTLKNEWIIIGSHYDHVGYGTAENSNGPVGKIHNGADDNASGVSVLLELAALFGQEPWLHDRSLLIAFWDAEEVGLYGSKKWVEQPSVALPSVKFALNLDMVGRLRDDHVAVMGWRSAPGLRRWIVDANMDTSLKFQFEPVVTADSDHHSFYSARRPVLHFDTRKHEDYHRPSDDVEKLNLAGLERISRLTARLVLHVANAPTLPEFRAEAFKEPATARIDQRARIAPPVRLGVRWNPQRPGDEPFLAVADVVPNTAAARAGIRKGDRLLKFDRWQSGSLDELRAVIAVAPNEVEIEWQSAGEPKPQSARIQLTGEGIRCGISYRQDPVCPGCGVVTSVMSHSPADRAGLQPGDVLMSVGGRELPAFDDFTSVLPTKAGSTEFVIDREGQLQRINVELP